MGIGTVFHWELGQKYVINPNEKFPAVSPLKRAAVSKLLLRPEANHVSDSRERLQCFRSQAREDAGEGFLATKPSALNLARKSRRFE